VLTVDLMRLARGLEPMILADAGVLVNLESPSRERPALQACKDELAGRLSGAGAAVEIVANDAGGDHVLARFSGRAGLRPALVLGHYDTVWPSGTIRRLPFRCDDGRAFGPGILDMKASLAIFLRVVQLIKGGGLEAPRPIWALFTSDEEIGSPTSRSLIESLARECAYVLVLEPARADGALKTARKGVGRFRIEILGRAAHAGAAPDEGRNAIVELAHQILRIQDFQDLGKGTTVNVGVVQGGTTANVVPAQASAEIDARVTSQSEAERLIASLESLSPIMPDIRLSVSGCFTRPPMERSPAIAALFEHARAIGSSLGLELSEGSTGGGSDGNFTAALGVPTLDGLGARGGGAHADDEHIIISSLAERAALLAALLLELRVES
jgi:glutamate carboxypeptidase